MSSLATEESENTEETQKTTEETTQETTTEETTETTGSWLDQFDPDLQKSEDFAKYSDAKKVWVPKELVQDYHKALQEKAEAPTPVESAEAYTLPEIEFQKDTRTTKRQQPSSRDWLSNSRLARSRLRRPGRSSTSLP